MRRAHLSSLALVFAFVAVSATRVRAEEPKCPLPIGECILQFGKMREKPWLGINVEQDSVTKQRIIRATVPGSPAEKAGIRPGDVLETIEGQEPPTWFAGRAGWKDGWNEGQTATLHVTRKGHARDVVVTPSHISEEYLAQIIGVHMIEGHFAYMADEELDQH